MVRAPRIAERESIFKMRDRRVMAILASPGRVRAVAAQMVVAGICSGSFERSLGVIQTRQPKQGRSPCEAAPQVGEDCQSFRMLDPRWTTVVRGLLFHVTVVPCRDRRLMKHGISTP